MTPKFRPTSKAPSRIFALAMWAVLPAFVASGAAMAQALPAPYVSHALDAVLLPIDDAVADAFGLGPDAYGALVLATQPGGWGDAAGLLPGDVIETVQKQHVATPIQIDEVVLYWINQGISDFGFDIWRDGALASSSWVITSESYYEEIEISSVSSWSSYSSESFSYESWYSEYSESISESYASSESMIEETITSEEFTSEVTSEETMVDESSTEEDTTEDMATDEASADDGDASGTDDMDADDAAADDAGADDAGGDAGAEDGGDAGAEDGGDAGGDEGGGDEG